jgi:hypothetical protein
MKNLPSNRASRANLAREHTPKSRFIVPVLGDKRNEFAYAYWTFSDLDCTPQSLLRRILNIGEQMNKSRMF